MGESRTNPIQDELLGGLTADDPRVVELREAVTGMNAAEDALVEQLPLTDDPVEVARLANAVADARRRFSAAMDVMP